MSAFNGRAARFVSLRVMFCLSVGVFILSAACVLATIPAVQVVVPPVQASSTPAVEPLPALLAATRLPTEASTRIPRSTETQAPAISPFYSFQDGPTRTPQPGQLTWRGDLHVHTDCSLEVYETLIDKALQLDFSFIAITDHFGFLLQKCCLVLQRCAAETRLFCIPGEEQFDGQHEIIALGHQTSFNQEPDLVSEITKIHQQNGLAIAPHPLGEGVGGLSQPFDEQSLYHSGFDAMECHHAGAVINQKQYEDSKKYHLPCVFVSDSHPPDNPIGKNFTICSTPVNSLADLKSALDQGLCWGYKQ